MASEVKNMVIEHYYSYNKRRYSTPWVCQMTSDGKYDFSTRVGTYTADHGAEGDLIISSPIAGQVYGYGQKDYRGKSEINYAKWTGDRFVACDKIGREMEN